MEWRYKDENRGAQHPSWLLNSLFLCYKWYLPLNTKIEKKDTIQHKEKHKNNKEAYTNGSKSIGKKSGFAAKLFIRKGTMFEEASIHTAEMSVIKQLWKKLKKQRQKMANIHTLGA